MNNKILFLFLKQREPFDRISSSYVVTNFLFELYLGKITLHFMCPPVSHVTVLPCLLVKEFLF